MYAISSIIIRNRNASSAIAIIDRYSNGYVVR